MFCIQVANYILWSLLLAAFHVCACAVIWKISTLPDTSKPWHILDLLCVQCTRRSFWQCLWKLCRRRLCSPRGVRRQTSIAGSTPSPESVPLQKPQVQSIAVTDEEITQTESDKKDPYGHVVAVLAKRLLENGNSWEEVALGLNRITTFSYLLGNALVFALYLSPLLYRIMVHSAVVGYLVDI